MASITSASPTQLVVEVPEDATAGPVSVTVNNQTAQGSIFTVIPGNVFDCSSNFITTDVTWEDVFSGDEVDYIIQCAISVKRNALLTIEAGVIIQFERQESGIFTSEGGGLKAVGTSTSSIQFLGSSEIKGTWKGVYFGSDHLENRLENVTIKHAGRSSYSQSGEAGAVQLSRKDESEAAIINCTINDNKGYGLFLSEESVLSEFTNNTITNNSQAPVGLFFNQLGSLDASSDYQGNSSDYVEVRENTIEEEVIVVKLNVPYQFMESKRYYITQTLNIGAGSILEFASDAGLRLGEQSSDCSPTTGALSATGTEADPIIFRGVSIGRGTRLGIGINSSGDENKLVYCTIFGGGSKQLYNAGGQGNLVIYCEGKAEVRNSTISDSGGWGY